MANPRYNSQVANKRVAKKDGGMMKPVDKKKNPGLAKLPKAVRNKMGYMKKGGRVKKSMGGMLKKVSRDFKKLNPKSNSTGPTRQKEPRLPDRLKRFNRRREQ